MPNQVSLVAELDIGHNIALVFTGRAYYFAEFMWEDVEVGMEYYGIEGEPKTAYKQFIAERQIELMDFICGADDFSPELFAARLEDKIDALRKRYGGEKGKRTGFTFTYAIDFD